MLVALDAEMLHRVVPGGLIERIEIDGVVTRADGRAAKVELQSGLRIEKIAQQLTSRGLVLSGKCVGRELVEIVELPDHPWFLAVQFHPELRSRPHDPHPLFRDFVRASLERRAARLGSNDFVPADREPHGATAEAKRS